MTTELSDEDDPLFRVAAYHRHKDDFMAMRSPPHEDALVRHTIVRAFPAPPTASLGSLRGLPLEFIAAICESLPIASYFRFRQVNRLARKLASHPRYQSSTDNCMEALRAALRTRIGTYFTMVDFYEATFTPECHACGLFGNFLFLPLFKRCCWSCVEHPDRLRLDTVAALAKSYGMNETKLLGILPAAHNLAARAYPLQFIRRSSVTDYLVSREVARDILRKLGIHLRPRKKEPCGLGALRPQQREMLVTAFPHVDRETRLRDHGVSCKGCLFAELYPRTYRQDNPQAHQVGRAYTRKEFLEHFHSCLPAQDLWARSLQGIVELEDEPLWLRNGGYPDLTYSSWAPDAEAAEGRRMQIRSIMARGSRSRNSTAQ
jgi:hypothetical protein